MNILNKIYNVKVLECIASYVFGSDYRRIHIWDYSVAHQHFFWTLDGATLAFWFWCILLGKMFHFVHLYSWKVYHLQPKILPLKVLGSRVRCWIYLAAKNLDIRASFAPNIEILCLQLLRMLRPQEKVLNWTGFNASHMQQCVRERA